MDYEKHYFRLIERAKNRKLYEGYETHHITPRCLGGNDTKENLVSLTYEEHYLAHQLLHRMYPDHSGLLYAAVKMCSNRPSNKLYGWLKRRLSQSQSIAMAGSGNTMYGKRWVSNESETLLLDEDIAKEYIDTGNYIAGKVAIKAPCGHIVRNRCMICEDKKAKSYERKKEEAKLMAEELFLRFKQSGIKSITAFAKANNTSQPRLTMLWKKYIPEYNQIVVHGKSVFK